MDQIHVEQSVQMINGFHIAEFAEKDGRASLRGNVMNALSQRFALVRTRARSLYPQNLLPGGGGSLLKKPPVHGPLHCVFTDARQTEVRIGDDTRLADPGRLHPKDPRFRVQEIIQRERAVS
jgi:hypothetical protein